jgi:hypothetical protein
MMMMMMMYVVWCKMRDWRNKLLGRRNKVRNDRSSIVAGKEFKKTEGGTIKGYPRFCKGGADTESITTVKVWPSSGSLF